jgi:glucose 1-dehydrogenase
MNWFGDATAVVTGAANGIGRGVAELLDQLGANVVAVDRDTEMLDAAFTNSDVVPWTADLAGDVLALAREITAAHGPVDLLVNNVGIDTPAGFLELGEDEFDLVFETNLRGPWFLTRDLARRMVSGGRRGSIVFISSLHDTFIRRYPHYSASKAAVAMLVKEAAQELAPHGVRVNAVSPGVIVSGHVPVDTTAAELEISRRLVPLGRKGTPGDVARMVAVLLNDDWSGYVTGANVRVDGGLGLHSWSVDER